MRAPKLGAFVRQLLEYGFYRLPVPTSMRYTHSKNLFQRNRADLLVKLVSDYKLASRAKRAGAGNLFLTVLDPTDTGACAPVATVAAPPVIAAAAPPAAAAAVALPSEPAAAPPTAAATAPLTTAAVAQPTATRVTPIAAAETAPPTVAAAVVPARNHAYEYTELVRQLEQARITIQYLVTQNTELQLQLQQCKQQEPVPDMPNRKRRGPALPLSPPPPPPPPLSPIPPPPPRDPIAEVDWVLVGTSGLRPAAESHAI